MLLYIDLDSLSKVQSAEPYQKQIHYLISNILLLDSLKLKVEITGRPDELVFYFGHLFLEN